MNVVKPTEQAKKLKNLGKGDKTKYAYDGPFPELLEYFLNSQPDRNYVVQFKSDEFNSLCPKTGAPDQATYLLRYVPGKKCIESKSFKLYLMSYRNAGAFMERITNDIINDLVKVLQPKGMTLEMDFNSRGGIGTVIYSEYIDYDLSDDEFDAVSSCLGI